MQKSHNVNIKNNVQETKRKKIIKQKLLQVHLSLEHKKVGYKIPIMNCYPRNGWFRDTSFLCHKLYYPMQYNIRCLQHPILWVVLNIRTIVARARLIRVQSQHHMKQFGLTIHSKTSLTRNSDNIIYKCKKLSMKIQDRNPQACFRLRGSLKANQSQLPCPLQFKVFSSSLVL